MSEYIERRALLNSRPEYRNPQQVGKEEYNKGWNDCANAYFECIDEQTAADVVEVKRGRWVPFKSTYAGDIQYCSACHIGCTWMPDYCPNCGADMRGADNG